MIIPVQLSEENYPQWEENLNILADYGDAELLALAGCIAFIMGIRLNTLPSNVLMIQGLALYDLDWDNTMRKVLRVLNPEQ